MPSIRTGEEWLDVTYPVQRVVMDDDLWRTWTYTSADTTGYITPITYNNEWVNRTWDNWHQAYAYTVTNTTGGSRTLITSHADVDPSSLASPNVQITGNTIEYNMHPTQGLSEEERVARRQAQHERLIERDRERVRDQQEYQEAQRQRRAAEEAAHERSLELLKLVLTTEEYAEYAEGDGFIRITGSSGGRYEIRQSGYEGNVAQLDEMNEEVTRLCAHPRVRVEGGRLPTGDAWVGQILALKTDEEHFLATANVHWSREAVRPRARQTTRATEVRIRNAQAVYAA